MTVSDEEEHRLWEHSSKYIKLHNAEQKRLYGHVCLDERLSGLRSDSKLWDYTPTVSQLCAFTTALPAASPHWPLSDHMTRSRHILKDDADVVFTESHQTLATTA